MPCYEFSCDPCNIYWEKVRPMSESGKGSMCPKCGKKGTRDYGVAHVNYNDGHIIEDLYAGKDETRAKEFYREAEKDTKNRLAQEATPYTPMKFDVGAMVKAGAAKMLSEKDAKKKKERMKKMTKIAYDKAGLDVTDCGGDKSKQNL